MRDEPVQQLNFPLLAALVEGSLGIMAVALGWLVDRPPLATFHGDVRWLALSLFAVVPPLIVLALCVWVPSRPFSDVLRSVDDILTPQLSHCDLIELAVISVLAGLGEEMLFRGVLQAALAEWLGGHLGVGGGEGAALAARLSLIMVAILFGLAHAVNRSYAILAGVIGLYLGWLWMVTGELLLPIAVHALYDFLALVYLVKIRPRRQPADD